MLGILIIVGYVFCGFLFTYFLDDELYRCFYGEEVYREDCEGRDRTLGDFLGAFACHWFAWPFGLLIIVGTWVGDLKVMGTVVKRGTKGDKTDGRKEGLLNGLL